MKRSVQEQVRNAWVKVEWVEREEEHVCLMEFLYAE